MRLVTSDDIIDVLAKGKQRGLRFLISKLTFNKLSRTKSAFDKSSISHSNWWIIPEIKERWNKLITGNPKVTYEKYMMKGYLKNKKNLRLLSIGSGSCSHELNLATYSNFNEIVCVDIADNRLKEAQKIAQKKNLKNISFICANALEYPFESNFDIVFFHSSLHHFDHISYLIPHKIIPLLKSDGHLIINEYVGPTRIQHPKHQLQAINRGLKLIPTKFRERFKTGWIKKRYRGSGLIRMILADPSECIDSSSILPTIHTHFNTIAERPYGGNILMHVLKDISHHFLDMDSEKKDILNSLFDFEDEYLQNQPSDFVFGIYQLKKS